jgi:hypothetical protein
MDFVFDKNEDGHRLKILTLVDDYSKKHLWLEADTALGGAGIARILDNLFLIHGKPECVRSDNGPELTSLEYISPRKLIARLEQNSH